MEMFSNHNGFILVPIFQRSFQKWEIVNICYFKTEKNIFLSAFLKSAICYENLDFNFFTTLCNLICVMRMRNFSTLNSDQIHCFCSWKCSLFMLNILLYFIKAKQVSNKILGSIEKNVACRLNFRRNYLIFNDAS